MRSGPLVARQPVISGRFGVTSSENPFAGVVDTELLTGPRKRAGFALRPCQFPASGRGGGNDGDSGAKRGSGLAAALSICVGPIGLRREPRGFRSASRPNLSNSLTLSVSAPADLTRGSDRGWAGIGTVTKRRARPLVVRGWPAGRRQPDRHCSPAEWVGGHVASVSIIDPSPNAGYERDEMASAAGSVLNILASKHRAQARRFALQR